MSYVYFLGAGFSAAYGLPVMNQFFSVARESKLLQTEEKKFLAEVQRFAHMGVRLITISRNNMEEILSFLEMAQQADQIPHRLTAQALGLYDEAKTAAEERQKVGAYSTGSSESYRNCRICRTLPNGHGRRFNAWTTYSPVAR